MVSKVIRRWTTYLVEINGSFYLPVDKAARESISADLGETLDKEKHQANMELSIGKLGMFLAAYFKKPK
jgi:hypothetical protein